MRRSRPDRPPEAREFGAFGPGSVIVPPCAVWQPEVVFVGERVVIHEGSSIVTAPGTDRSPRVVLGNGARFGRFCAIYCAGEVVVGENVMTSDEVVITDWSPRRPRGRPSRVEIEEGAYLGAGSTVLPGVRVGRGAFVGEGSVVTRDVPEHAVVYGNPAQIVRRFDARVGTWSEA